MTVSNQHITATDFETLYILTRKREGRMYTDEEVAGLPLISPSHVHAAEWDLRKRSAQKLIDHLKKKKKALDILEIGCGNGWLCHRLASATGNRVIGTDINFTEIEQAARVFRHIPNLHFIYASADADIFREGKFDCIVFAASIQYFESLRRTLQNTIALLKPGGEIHIIDSFFYRRPALLAARQRSRHYYEKLGLPEMSRYYHHHTLEDLEGYRYIVRYDPNSFFNKISRSKNPFYWIVIRQKN